MTSSRHFHWPLIAFLMASFGCTSAPTPPPPTDSGAPDIQGDTGTNPKSDRPDVGAEVVAPPCVDTDNDGMTDMAEGAPTQDTDTDGMPDYMDPDSDNDGFSDRDEAIRSYPGFESSARMFLCGGPIDNCDAPPDNLSNPRDLDSDNDGLTDAEERSARTNPCQEDTDRDGFTDLAEVVARSNPTDMTSRPPEGSLYVVLPYYAPGTRGPRETREFTFQTRIQQADVMFLIDNSASTDRTIEALRTNFSTMIVPGIRNAIRDVRMGVASFDSMPDGTDGMMGSPGDYTLWVRQRLTADTAAVQRAFDAMNSIARDTSSRFLGGDTPECETEALYQVLEGSGRRARTGVDPDDPAALRSTRNALDPMGNGWPARMNPARDCDGDADAYGWGCFRPGRVPIVVMAADGPWYDGPLPGTMMSPIPDSLEGHRFAELAEVLTRRSALFVGIDISDAGNLGFSYANSVRMAMLTRTLNAMNREVVFAPATSGGIERISNNIVTAIGTLANETRQDITTTRDPDRTETRLPMGRTTADFITQVAPLRGTPPQGMGYDRQDASTFYNVLPSTSVVFRAEFYNDFVEWGDAARVFQATIVVRGRAGTEVDRRPVFIVVPARGGGLPPG
jgi:hypothetical protein